MKSWISLLGATSLVLGGCATGQSSQRDLQQSRDYDRLLIELAEIVRSKLSMTGGPICEVRTEGHECTIQMDVITYNLVDYCIARAQEVKVYETKDKERFVNWSLDKTSFAGGRKIQFHSEAGIVFLLDASNKDLIDDNANSRGHGNGDVIEMPVPTYKFHIRTKKINKKAMAPYLPIILWDAKNDGNWELCAAVDPKIVNEP